MGIVSKKNKYSGYVESKKIDEHKGTEPHKHPHEDEEIEVKKSATGYELYHRSL